MVNPWQGRRVFLTGHTGFKGGWLAVWLAELGAVVRGYSLDPLPDPSFFSEVGVGKLVEDIRGDIRDYSPLEAAMTEFAPEVVFHLAAQPLVRQSYADPLGTYSTNVMGTAHLLEAVRKTPTVRAVVCVTTDKCYQNKEWVWPYREEDPLGGYDPYSSSKACAEIVSAAYRSSYFPMERIDEHKVAIATARAGNVIGGGDWSEDRLIPDLLRGFKSNEPVLIRQPDAIRPWQHVLEPLKGYIQLAEHLLGRKVEALSSFNFGPLDADAWPVKRIANTLKEMWGEGAAWVSEDEAGVHEAQTLKLDSSKARAALGWRARLGLETALRWTMDWHGAWMRGEDMKQLTRTQIQKYEGFHD